MTLYIIRLHEPLARKDGGAQYYLGYSDDDNLMQRLQAHRYGKGARFTQVAKERGIGWDIVMVFPGDRARERQIKNQGSIRRFLLQHMKRQGYVPKWLEKGFVGSVHGSY